MRTFSLIALLRDGFHEQSQGGRVELRGDGTPVLDYPLTDYLFDGARRALLSMAQIQFEAGVVPEVDQTEVMDAHIGRSLYLPFHPPLNPKWGIIWL